MEDKRFRKMLIDAVSGRMVKDSPEVFRTRNGKICVVLRYDKPNDPKTEGQLDARDDFKLANLLASEDLKDPKRRAVWQAQMEEHNQRAKEILVRENEAGRVRWEDDQKHLRPYYRLCDFVKSQYKMALAEERRNSAKELEDK